MTVYKENDMAENQNISEAEDESWSATLQGGVSGNYYEGKSSYGWNTFETKDISSLTVSCTTVCTSGTTLKAGECVSISTLDPGAGVRLLGADGHHIDLPSGEYRRLSTMWLQTTSLNISLNDWVTKVQVAQGCEATVYSGSYFQNSSGVLSGNATYDGGVTYGTGAFKANDVSSLKVTCTPQGQ